MRGDAPLMIDDIALGVEHECWEDQHLPSLDSVPVKYTTLSVRFPEGLDRTNAEALRDLVLKEVGEELQKQGVDGVQHSITIGKNGICDEVIFARLLPKHPTWEAEDAHEAVMKGVMQALEERFERNIPETLRHDPLKLFVRAYAQEHNINIVNEAKLLKNLRDVDPANLPSGIKYHTNTMPVPISTPDSIEVSAKRGRDA